MSSDTPPLTFNIAGADVAEIAQKHADIEQIVGELYKYADQLFEAMKVFSDIKVGPQGEQGPVGDPGKDSDHQKVVRDVAKLFRQPKDGVAPAAEHIAAVLLPQVVKKIKKGLPPTPAASVLPEVRIPTPQDFIDAFMALLNEGKVQLQPGHIAGFEGFVAEVRNRAANDTWRGGGDTVVAGSGVTITNTVNGNKQIAVSSSGTVVYSETVAGSGTTFTLAHTPIAGTLRLYGNGQRLLAGAGNDYTLSGVTITLANSFSAATILADYSY